MAPPTPPPDGGALIGALVVSSLAVLLAAVGLLLALVTRRAQLSGRERRRVETERRLRGLALAVVDGDPGAATAVADRDAAIFAGLLTRYARSLDGDARRSIGAWFEATGRVAPAVARLGDRRAWRRAAAAHQLGDMSSGLALGPLLVALRDPSRDVRAAAARSLGRLGDPRAVGPLVDSLVAARVPRAVAGHALISIGGDAVGPLRSLTGAVAAEVRQVAVDVLGAVGTAGDADLCRERLRDASADVRAAAARALGRLGAGTALPALEEGLEDRIPFVRAAAATALGRLGDPRAVPALLRQANDDTAEPAQAAAHAILTIDPRRLRLADADAAAGRFLHEAADLAEVRAA